jgi:hypothetical protein
MVAPLATVLVLAVLWCVYWVIASAVVRTAYAEGVRRLSSDGIAISCGETRWGGFPFRVEHDCSAPRVMMTRGNETVVISATDALVVVQIWDPRHAVALLDGPTELSGPGPEEIRHGRAVASLKMSLDRTWQASVEVPNVIVEPIAKAQRILLHARDRGGATVDVAMSAAALELRLSDGARLPLAAVAISASLPRDALEHDITHYLARTGREIVIDSVSAEQGDLKITGSGKIGIDAEGYVEGRIATSTSRIDLLLDLIGPIARLKPEDVRTAKTFLGLLQTGSGSSATAIDVIAKDRKLYLGPFKIADLEPLF